jgi:hypothetical protein
MIAELQKLSSGQLALSFCVLTVIALGILVVGKIAPDILKQGRTFMLLVLGTAVSLPIIANHMFIFTLLLMHDKSSDPSLVVVMACLFACFVLSIVLLLTTAYEISSKELILSVGVFEVLALVGAAISSTIKANPN